MKVAARYMKHLAGSIFDPAMDDDGDFADLSDATLRMYKGAVRVDWADGSTDFAYRGEVFSAVGDFFLGGDNDLTTATFGEMLRVIDYRKDH